MSTQALNTRKLSSRPLTPKIMNQSLGKQTSKEARDKFHQNRNHIRNSSSMGQVLSREHILEPEVVKQLEQERSNLLKSKSESIRNNAITKPTKSILKKSPSDTIESTYKDDKLKSSKSEVINISRPRSAKKAVNSKYLDTVQKRNPITWKNKGFEAYKGNRQVTIPNSGSKSNYMTAMSGDNMKGLLGF
jgi:glycerol-3-phosphate dehydrogenase